MDLIPTTGQLASATKNVFNRVLYGGVADLRLMPRTLIHEGDNLELYHYRTTNKQRTPTDPVLLVTPLAAPSLCYDLRRGCSLVERLLSLGHATYLLEYGEIHYADRNLGIEDFVEEILPIAIRETSKASNGRPVHLVGWSLGGTFSILAAALEEKLPIASVSVVGSPVDVRHVPLVAPLRPLLKYDAGIITGGYRMMGGAPKPLVRRAFQLTSGAKIVTKPLATLQNLDDTEWLAQIEAVDRFTKNIIAYPGRSFGQLYHRMLMSNEFKTGKVKLKKTEVDVRDVTVPVQVFAGNTDGIAPIKSVKALMPMLESAAETRFEIVPGGHLGMLTGRAARQSTWVLLDEWIRRFSSDNRPASDRASKATSTSGRSKVAGASKSTAAKKTPKKSATNKKVAKKAASKKAAPKKAVSKKTAPAKATKKASAKKAATKKKAAKQAPANKATKPPIGSSRERRYGSASSRSLAPKK